VPSPRGTSEARPQLLGHDLDHRAALSGAGPGRRLRWAALGELVGLRVKRVDLLAAVTLAEHLTKFAEPGPEGLAFPAPEGGYLRRSNFRRRCWLPATRAAGVEGLRFHDLRHSAATLALAAGANSRELMERMGHTSPAVALRYQHVMAGRDQAIAAALDELVQAAALLVGADLGCWWWR
jgi:integrase